MSDNKKLNTEELKKVSGGDALEEAVKQSLKEQEEAKLNQLIEDVEKNRQSRESNELGDLVDNMIDMLKKLTGDDNDGSDGQIHIG